EALLGQESLALQADAAGALDRRRLLGLALRFVGLRLGGGQLLARHRAHDAGGRRGGRRRNSDGGRLAHPASSVQPSRTYFGKPAVIVIGPAVSCCTIQAPWSS